MIATELRHLSAKYNETQPSLSRYLAELADRAAELEMCAVPAAQRLPETTPAGVARLADYRKAGA